MSDGYDGSGQMPRRSPRVGEPSGQVSGVLAIVLAAVAVIAGFLILRSLAGDSTATDALPFGPSETRVTTLDATETTLLGDPGAAIDTTVTVPEPVFVTTGASVMVVNANGKDGSAKGASDALAAGAQFQMVTPTDASSTYADAPTSLIYYDGTSAEALAVANSLNQVLGGTFAPQIIPATGAPVKGGDLAGATVLLMLGTDFSEMTAADLILPNVVAATPDPAGTADTSSSSSSSTIAPG